MTAPAAAPRRTVLFAPAAGPGVGGGHVMRCLTLADALRARGADCTFAVDGAGAALVERFGGEFAVIRAPLREIVEREAIDTLVLDDYALGAADQAPLRRKVRRLAVIDDLADRAHLADLLIDPGHRRREGDYRGLLPPGARLLIGPAFAPLRAPFAALRPAALARPLAVKPERIFVSFGLSDIGGVAARALAAIRARDSEVRIDLALASDAQSLPALQARAAADPLLTLHIDEREPGPLMAAADLAVGAGGASTWERCCLGLPSLAVIVAENQRPVIEGLAADGALLSADLSDPAFEAAFATALDRIWRPDTRVALRARSGGLCDGLGADRVADALLAL